MVTLRLNTSHLLHSRIHWRPTALADLKVNTLLYLVYDLLCNQSVIKIQDCHHLLVGKIRLATAVVSMYPYSISQKYMRHMQEVYMTFYYDPVSMKARLCFEIE